MAPRGKPAVDEIPRSDRIAWQARGRPRRGVRKEGDPDEGLGGRDTFEAKARRMVGAGGDLLPPQVSLEQLDAVNPVRLGAHQRGRSRRQGLRTVDGAFLEEGRRVRRGRLEQERAMHSRQHRQGAREVRVRRRPAGEERVRMAGQEPDEQWRLGLLRLDREH